MDKAVPVLTFFNNKGGVGKTSLVYHLACMYAETGWKVVAADLDPQANLTAAFLDDETIESLWDESAPGTTIYNCVKPLTGVGDIASPIPYQISQNLYLIPGDVQLSSFEETLSGEWPASLGDNNLYRPMRILSSFWTVIQMAAKDVQAELIIVDIGPNLGAINRSALLASDFVAIPLGADLFSLQGLKNLGPTMRNWRSSWNKRLSNWRESAESINNEFELPEGTMNPLGYLCQQYGVRMDRPVKAYDKWVQRVPEVYRTSVLNEKPAANMKQENDPCCLAIIKHYRSLIPMAQEHRKPIFKLTSADGAIGSHANAVADSRKDFEALAQRIMRKMKSIAD